VIRDPEPILTIGWRQSRSCSREAEVVRYKVRELYVCKRQAITGARRDDDVRRLLHRVRQHVRRVGENTALEQDEIVMSRRAGLEVDD
jgi:hypothetical protein